MIGKNKTVGFGGLHALALIYVIKVGFLILAGVAWTLFYFWTKWYTKSSSCLGVPIIREAPPVIQYQGYSAPHDILAFDHPPPDYNGPDPYSAYSHLHPDISSPDSHPPIGDYNGDIHPGPSSYSGGDIHPGPSDYSDHPGISGYGGDVHSGATGYGDAHPGSSDYGDVHHSGPPAATYGVPDHAISSGAGGVSSSPPYRRVSVQQQQQQRQLSGTGFENVNWGELVFRFLGVDSNGCRKRFICEFDFKAKQNPFTRMAYSFIDRNFFDQYRDQSAEKPKRYRDCARIYMTCHAMGATAYQEDQDGEHESDHVESTTTLVVEDVTNNVIESEENKVESNKTEKQRSSSLESINSLLTRFSAKMKG